ncbi:MAG: leucine/isoleucine/valine transporter permease subunit [Acidimicrobiia bacterium]
MTDRRYTRRLGWIGGVAMAFMAMIGMIEEFNERLLVSPFLTLGYSLLFGIPLLVGWLASKGVPNPLEDPIRDPRRGAITGLVTGAIAGVIACVPVILANSLNLTRFLLNMRPQLVDAMTFDLGVPLGIVALVATSAVVGALGGFLFGLPETVRKGISTAAMWVFGVALFEAVVNDLFDFMGRGLNVVYTPFDALQPWAAVIIGVLVYWLSTKNRGRVKEFTEKVKEADPRSRLRRSLIGLAAVLVIVLPMLLGLIINELLVNVTLFILMGLGLNIVVGLAGLLDLGYVAFFAVGAYGTAVLTSPLSSAFTPTLNWWVALAVVMVMATLAGLLVGTPVIRMRGDYLAIVTLGFGEIVRLLLLSDWLTPLFGGAQGIRRIPGVSVPFLDQVGGTRPQLFIYIMMAFVALAVWISHRAQNSRIGRSWAAMREDEDVAEAIGIGTVKAKLLAFISGAIIAAFAGALFSAKVGTVFTNSFDVLVSIIILVVVIVGGMGSIRGVIVGAIVLIGVLGGPKLPGLLVEFTEYKLLIYGAILIFMMLKRPEGLIPSVRRSRELHQDESQQDDWMDRAGRFGEEPQPATVEA